MPITLSLVIPAYNEADRLPPYLAAIHDYFDAIDEPDFRGYEVIVINDGSRDRTGELVHRWAEDWPQLRLREHAINRGKGAAVRDGMLAAKGEVLLFADADGATPIAEERRLRSAIEGGADLVVGSRLAPGAGLSRYRHRALLGNLFATAARAIVPVSVLDTQCGFKMFRREVGIRLFAPCREDGYLFDLQILALAAYLGYRVEEVAISWHEVAGSKVSLIHDPWKMFLGLLRMRRSLAEVSGQICRSPLNV